MPQIQRETDKNGAGGTITTSALVPPVTVFANGLFVSVDGSVGTPDLQHPNWKTAQGCSTVFAGNGTLNSALPVNFTENFDTLNHPRVGGSDNVFLCGSRTGEGAMIDHAATYLPELLPTAPLGAIPPPTIPDNAQPTPPPGYQTNTESDVHVSTLNDDPDDLNVPPVRATMQDIEQVINDPTPAPAPLAPGSCTPLPSSFNWNTFYPGPVPTPPSSFATWARNPVTYPEANIGSGYSVADLSYDTAVSRYSFSNNVNQASGLSQSTIIQNLCLVVSEILVPIFNNHNTNFIITSGFRQQSSGTQHANGEAVDLQFPGLSRNQYFTLAQAIRDDISVKYDQLILEWFGRNPWLHISTSATTLRRNVLTQTSSNSYSPGLILLG